MQLGRLIECYDVATVLEKVVEHFVLKHQPPLQKQTMENVIIYENQEENIRIWYSPKQTDFNDQFSRFMQHFLESNFVCIFWRILRNEPGLFTFWTTNLIRDLNIPFLDIYSPKKVILTTEYKMTCKKIYYNIIRWRQNGSFNLKISSSTRLFHAKCL